MKVWKHHISENFEKGHNPLQAGVGKGATMFCNYDYMIQYLLEDGRKWHVICLELNERQYKAINPSLGVLKAVKGISSSKKYYPVKIRFTDALFFLLKSRTGNRGKLMGADDGGILDKAAELSGVNPFGRKSIRYSKLLSYVKKDKRFAPFRFKSKMIPSGKPCTRVGYTINVELYEILL